MGAATERKHHGRPSALDRAKENGVTEDEFIEVITHVTFYAGWPKGMGSMNIAKQLFTENN
jgi:4-carboxymuconolactone decarboxylase